MQEDGDSSATSSPCTDRQVVPAQKKKRRGVRLSKQEREARQQQRLAVAQGSVLPSEDPTREAFCERRQRLLLHVEHGQWNEAGALGAETVQLAEELLRALEPLDRHKLTTHLAATVVKTVPSAALAHLVQHALDQERVAYAAALARGLALAEPVDLVAPILRCYESGRVQEAADALGGDRPMELRTLHAMLRQSRALPYALQYAPALRHLPPPDAPQLAAIGAQARALSEPHEPDGGGGGAGDAAALAEAVRARLESALRASAFPDVRLHTFGSASLGLASAASDVDVCALLPSNPAAHCRDAIGRRKLAPVLAAAAEALRSCPGVSGLQVVSEGRTPLLRLEFDAPVPRSSSSGATRGELGACTSVELCFNNTDGLANTYVVRELLGVTVGGVDNALRMLAAVARHWAKRRRLGSTHNTLNAYSWTLLAANSLQQLSDSMPVVNASSSAFAALLELPAITPDGQDAWQALARASLSPNRGGLDQALQAARMLGSPSSPPPPLASCGSHPAPPTQASCASPLPTATATTADVQLGLLVWHFFLLWGVEFPYRRRIISLRQPNDLSKATKGWTRRDEQAMMLEDPIEINRDLARLVGRPPLHAMRLDACLALFTLQAGGSLLDDVCAPSDWRLREHAQLLGAARVEDFL